VTEYLLSNHVHMRLIREGAIFLDLRRDEYLTLNQEQVAALSRMVRGWPCDFQSATTTWARGDGPAEEFAGTLLERGLLTSDALAGRPAAQVELDAAETSLVEENTANRTGHGRHMVNFLSACIGTSLALRWRPLERIVDGVRKRKQAQAAMPRQTSVRELQELMSTFLLMRPLVYTQKAKCLFDSLTLVNFLAAYRIFPDLVFAVRTHPFEAHAWVQHGRCALNYPAEYVRSFSPIMVV
jgi:hypothetical protein